MMMRTRRVPNNEETEPELTEDEALPAVQTEENAESAAENAAAEEPLQHVFEAEEVTKEDVDRLERYMTHLVGVIRNCKSSD